MLLGNMGKVIGTPVHHDIQRLIDLSNYLQRI